MKIMLMDLSSMMGMPNVATGGPHHSIQLLLVLAMMHSKLSPSFNGDGLKLIFSQAYIVVFKSSVTEEQKYQYEQNIINHGKIT